MQKTFKIPAGMPILDNLAVIAIATAKTIQIPTFKLRRPNKTIFLPDGMVHLFRQYKNSLGLHTEEIALCGLSYTAIKNGHEFKRLPDGDLRTSVISVRRYTETIQQDYGANSRQVRLSAGAMRRRSNGL